MIPANFPRPIPGAGSPRDWPYCLRHILMHLHERPRGASLAQLLCPNVIACCSIEFAHEVIDALLDSGAVEALPRGRYRIVRPHAR